jgi:hypothetical protein
MPPAPGQPEPFTIVFGFCDRWIDAPQVISFTTEQLAEGGAAKGQAFEPAPQRLQEKVLTEAAPGGDEGVEGKAANEPNKKLSTKKKVTAPQRPPSLLLAVPRRVPRQPLQALGMLLCGAFAPRSLLRASLFCFCGGRR